MEKITTEEKKKRVALRQAIREKTVGYILTALGLVAGLAWNDAISSFIKFFFPLDQNGLTAKIVYAVVVTIIIVLTSQWLLRFSEPKQ